MQAVVVGQCAYCPACDEWCEYDVLTPGLPVTAKFTLTVEDFYRNFGEDQIIFEMPNVRAREVWECPNCEESILDNDEGFPTMQPIWECGNCQAKYYGTEGEQYAVNCCKR